MSFSMRTSSPCEFQGTIRLKKMPSALGIYKDLDGVAWDFYGIFNGPKYGPWVQAKKMNELHPYFTDTSGRGYSDTTGNGPFDSTLITERFMPYKIEIVEDEEDPSEP